jgi:hypothetical protein
MKIFTFCLAFFMLLSVLSCENPDQQNPSISENEEILSLFTVKETTQALGVFDKFQGEELVVEKTPNSNLYRMKGKSIIISDLGFHILINYLSPFIPKIFILKVVEKIQTK